MNVFDSSSKLMRGRNLGGNDEFVAMLDSVFCPAHDLSL